MTAIQKLLRPTKSKRALFFLVNDVLILIGSYFLSFFIRFGFVFPPDYPHLHWLGGMMAVKVLLLAWFGLYNCNWRFVGLSELLNLIKAAVLATSLIYLVNWILRIALENLYDLPRGIILIDAILGFTMIGVLRISKRIYIQVFKSARIGRRALIIGADHTSDRVIKELIYSEEERLFPVAIVDDDPMKIKTKISGITVYGGYDRIPDLITQLSIESVLINLPRASHKKLSTLFDLIKQTGISDIKVVPQVNEFESSIHRLKEFKQLEIEDLLSRESVQIDFHDVKSYLRGKRIMVTGAAGSIGSEIVRQLIFFEVEKIIAVEVDETEVFNRELEVQKIKRDNQEIVFIIGDIREEQKMETVFDAYHPEIVFHAAAYKHVPLMERFPEEAVKTNVLGTFSLANLAVKFGVKKFINISTDKAVNPTSVMGASKRLAEIICRGMNGSESRFISVRFGNVLGSRGSVIPLFLKQIEEGGPLTVTHPDMQRYFMSEKEAVILVFQATLMGEGGEVFVLDMGEPVKIKQMAETLIRLNNLVPYEDIDIVFSGLRPGEKLFEELLTAEEGTDLTTHEKIYIAKNSSNYDSDKIAGLMAQLKRTIPDGEKLIKFLKQNVPYYH